MKINRKAQIKFDFLIGFFLFTLAVIYSANSAIQTFPRYTTQSAENELRLEAWRSSDDFMRVSEIKGIIDTNMLSTFSGCVRYNANNGSSIGAYENVKTRLNVSGSNNIHLTFDILLFGITDTGNNALRNGKVIFRGNSYTISVQNTSNYFNEVRTTGGWSSTTVDVGIETFDVLKIDYDGEFVILRKRIVNCGPNIPALASNAVVRRYSTYNGSVAMAEIIYW